MSRVKKNENLHIKINRWMKSHERSHPTDNKIWKNERSFKWKGGGDGKDQNSYLIKHAVPLKELENTGKLFTCITKKALSKEKTLSLILKIAISTYATSISIPTPPICPKNSTAVTCEPSLDQTEPLKTNQ